MPGTNAPHPELECAEQRLQRLWCDLAMAEQQGSSDYVLERLGRLYMRALDEYVQLQQRVEHAPPGLLASRRRSA